MGHLDLKSLHYQQLCTWIPIRGDDTALKQQNQPPNSKVTILFFCRRYIFRIFKVQMYLICFIIITQTWTFLRSFCQITMMVAFLDLNICYSVITLNPLPPPSWQTSVKDNWMTCKRENEGKLFPFHRWGLFTGFNFDYISSHMGVKYKTEVLPPLVKYPSLLLNLIIMILA